MHASPAESAARTHREEGCGTTQKGPDESGPFEPPWGEDSFAVTRLYGGNAQRVKQAVEGALQVNPLVRGAAFGGVEEASSLCRGEGEMVRTSELRPGGPGALDIVKRRHARASSSSTGTGAFGPRCWPSGAVIIIASAARLIRIRKSYETLPER